ncbi:hypothetical protein OGY83_22295, partial [Citrobacter sp. Cpo090]|uniref:hypothetical protein n=1 Tax=Citrobacter sp. Cpo090 TaxID=2985139 RepID=UPI0025752D0F
MRYAYQAYKTGNSDVGRIRRWPHPARGVSDALRLSGLQDRHTDVGRIRRCPHPAKGVPNGGKKLFIV